MVAEHEDAGLSGATIDGRPGMKALLRSVRAGEVDVVLTAEWERLSRSPKGRDWPAILDACEESGAVLATPQGQMDPRNLEDQFLSGLFGLLAARERAKTARRTMKGKMERIRSGRPMPSRYPTLGYCYSKDVSGKTLTHQEWEKGR